MKTNEIWTPPKLVNWLAGDMERRDFPPPHRLEAELMVAHALKISRLDIYLQFDKPCRPDEQARLREIYQRRLKREPLAYILGHCEFWSLTFKVGPGVLIPRPDTEILLEQALTVIPEVPQATLTILELGSGSGIIPIVLGHERQNLKIFSVDKSPEALAYANTNLETYREELTKRHNEITFLQSDRFEHPDIPNPVDIIISNPPYIPDTEIAGLQAEVRQWEPQAALAGGTSGFDFYDYLLKQAEKRLNPGGYILFEHGFDQQDEISRRFLASPVLAHEVRLKDYAGNDRVLQYQKTSL